jgi:SOS response regulatory protein OraA/RecX
MSRWELQESLRRHGIDDQVAQDQVAGLIRQGLLDDRALAATLIETRFARKGLGRAGMRRELQRRHIAEDDIEAALAEIPEAQDRDRALSLARARAAHREEAEPAAARRRLSSYLTRRGYPASLVVSVVHDVLGGADDESRD